jgi:hypothetical protein
VFPLETQPEMLRFEARARTGLGSGPGAALGSGPGSRGRAQPLTVPYCPLIVPYCSLIVPEHVYVGLQFDSVISFLTLLVKAPPSKNIYIFERWQLGGSRWSQMLLRGVGMVCPPGKHHSENFQKTFEIEKGKYLFEMFGFGTL